MSKQFIWVCLPSFRLSFLQYILVLPSLWRTTAMFGQKKKPKNAAIQK